MQRFRIPKGRNKFRTVYKLDDKEKEEFKILRRQCEELAFKYKTDCSHGFVVARSPITNAKPHIGYQYTLSFDLLDFFDSIGWNHLKDKVSRKILRRCLVKGRLRQGLPTSPALSNVAAYELDILIEQGLPKGVIYTRYADDLTFSFNNEALIQPIKDLVHKACFQCNFKLNFKKTHLQCAKGGRRIITGVAVDDKDLYPTRAVRRKLRAAIHQGNKQSARGLEEWCQLKEPVCL